MTRFYGYDTSNFSLTVTDSWFIFVKHVKSNYNVFAEYLENEGTIISFANFCSAKSQLTNRMSWSYMSLQISSCWISRNSIFYPKTWVEHTNSLRNMWARTTPTYSGLILNKKLSFKIYCRCREHGTMYPKSQSGIWKSN